MLDHRFCLFQLARNSHSAGDWDKFYSFSKRFDTLLTKYNKNLEKKIISRANAKGFFKFLNKKLKGIAKFHV